MSERKRIVWINFAICASIAIVVESFAMLYGGYNQFEVGNVGVVSFIAAFIFFSEMSRK
jgi:hypothetical protein